MPKKTTLPKPNSFKRPWDDERWVAEREADRVEAEREADAFDAEARLGGHANEEEAEEASRIEQRELGRLEENRD